MAHYTFMFLVSGVWLFILLLHVIVRGSEICSERLGCFSNDPPWSRTLQRPFKTLPQPPKDINTTFLLYTRKNPSNYQVISATDPSTITASNFNPEQRTRFIIHGYMTVDSYDWFTKICKLLVEKEDINCIFVNWKCGAFRLYERAVQNIRVVGAEVATLLEILQENYNYSSSSVHIIGHGLGANAAGEAGRLIRGLSRITGLDPPGPLFEDTSPEVKLNPTDAVFVDVIHTSTDRLSFGIGINEPCGHIDFYPNGGQHMPGCKNKCLVPKYSGGLTKGELNEAESLFLGCSHERSILYYFESISVPNGFLGYRCDSYDSFLSGNCFPCPKKGCPMMGHYADMFPDKTKAVHQIYYLNTGASQPFASWRKHLRVKLSGNHTERGNAFVALIDKNEVRSHLLIAKEFLRPGTSFARFADVAFPGDPAAVEFKWEKQPTWGRTGYIGAQEVTLINGEDGQKSVFCGIKAVQPDVWQKLEPC